MKIAFFFPIGGGFKELKKTGQDKRFEKAELSQYVKSFDKITLYSYIKESRLLPKKVTLLGNKKNIHRFIYTFLIPFLYIKQIKEADILRGSQLTSTIPCIVSKIFLGKKFVFNHAYDHAEFSKIKGDWFSALILKLWEQAAIRLANGIIAANPILTKRVKTLNKNTIYLPNGVDLSMYKFRRRKSKKITRLLFVGRLEKQKNLENLLLGVKQFNGKDIEVMMIGEGSLKTKLKEMTKSLSLKVVFLPFVENERLLDYYYRADIFVLASLAEGSPKVVLEAQATGLPVVVNESFAKGLIKNGQTGIFCQSDPKSIASALRKIVGNTKLKETVANNARQETENNYDIKKIMQKEINFLKKTAYA